MWKWWGSPCLCEIDGLRSWILFLTMEVPVVPVRTAMVDCTYAEPMQILLEVQEVACCQHPTCNSWGMKAEGLTWLTKIWEQAYKYQGKAKFHWLNVGTYHNWCVLEHPRLTLPYMRGHLGHRQWQVNLCFSGEATEYVGYTTKFKIALCASSFYNVFISLTCFWIWIVWLFPA